MKILRSKKALSPVVAAIILIAVTVAVSIAVAAWMGALTIGFMKVEKLEVMGHTWDAVINATKIKLAVKNTGTKPLTLAKVEVNDVEWTKTTGAVSAGKWNCTDLNLDVGESAYVYIACPSGETSFDSGVTYNFEIVTTTNYVCPYAKQAP